MKRGVIDVLRRGLDDTVANWPLILIRVGETIVFAAISIAAIFVLLVPAAISIGISLSNLKTTPEDIEGVLMLLASRWIVLVWILVGAFILIGVFLAMHSFVEAGCARVFVDAEKAAGAANEGPRSRFHLFSMERWMSGGTSGWWTIFWIYNVAWGLAGLILLIPLIPTIILMLVFGEEPAVLIGVGVAGLAVTVMLGIVVAIITGMWTNRAIVDWAAHGDGANAALSRAWKSFRADLGRHVLVALAALVVAMAGSSFFASFSFFAAFSQATSHHGMFDLVTLPIRLLVSLASTAFSAFVTNWYVAAYASLAVENK
jgi:hypothetical protein